MSGEIMGELNLFDTLFKIDVNNHTEKKQGLTYLSWAWAWAEFRKVARDATYKVWRDPSTSRPYTHDEATGYMVSTSVTADGETHEMWLPVMDSSNKAMKSTSYTYAVKEYKNGQWTGEYIDKSVEQASMFDVNKAIMRCLVKNMAMFGLGLYIYAGEDLPEEGREEKDRASKLKKSMAECRDKLADKKAEILSQAFADHGYVSSLTEKGKWLISVIKQVGSVEKLETIEKRVAEIESKTDGEDK